MEWWGVNQITFRRWKEYFWRPYRQRWRTMAPCWFSVTVRSYGCAQEVSTTETCRGWRAWLQEEPCRGHRLYESADADSNIAWGIRALDTRKSSLSCIVFIDKPSTERVAKWIQGLWIQHVIVSLFMDCAVLTVFEFSLVKMSVQNQIT